MVLYFLQAKKLEPYPSSNTHRESLTYPRAGFVAGSARGLYAYPREKSICCFMDQVRQRTKRKVPLKIKELLAELNLLLRGWGEHYKRADVLWVWLARLWTGWRSALVET